MKKTIIITVLLIVVCIALAGCGQKEEQNQINEVKEAKKLTIELNANPTTGYMWEFYSEDEMPNEIIKIEEEYITDQVDEKIAGAGGKEVFTITGLKPGKATITFKYARGWETSENDRIAIYEFTVDENLNVTETHSGSYFE